MWAYNMFYKDLEVNIEEEVRRLREEWTNPSNEE